MKFKRLVKKICIIFAKILGYIAYDRRYLTGRLFEETSSGWLYVLKNIVWQKVFRINGNIPFPVSPLSKIYNHENIIFHPDDMNNFQSPGVYFQNFKGKIYIGRGSYIAPNVGLITSNHDLKNLEKSISGEDIVIGEKCWIGMNSVLLPGTILGNNTIVGAGAVVTKSFKEGNCIIGGVPAKKIKEL